jgi:hypothetical protein
MSYDRSGCSVLYIVTCIPSATQRLGKHLLLQQTNINKDIPMTTDTCTDGLSILY